MSQTKFLVNFTFLDFIHISIRPEIGGHRQEFGHEFGHLWFRLLSQQFWPTHLTKFVSWTANLTCMKSENVSIRFVVHVMKNKVANSIDLFGINEFNSFIFSPKNRCYAITLWIFTDTGLNRKIKADKKFDFRPPIFLFGLITDSVLYRDRLFYTFENANTQLMHWLLFCEVKRAHGWFLYLLYLGLNQYVKYCISYTV